MEPVDQPKKEYLRHVMGACQFELFCLDQNIYLKKLNSPIEICAAWAKHVKQNSEKIPKRERNAIKRACDIMVHGYLVICMDMGHINTKEDYSHSHIKMLIPRDMLHTFEQELETHAELKVYFVDAGKEIEMRTQEHYMNPVQQLNHIKNTRQSTLIAKSRDYYNYTGLYYPLDEIKMLAAPLADIFANEYICVHITFVESSPETRIDFVLGPILRIITGKK